jgi:hypothetical protein
MLGYLGKICKNGRKITVNKLRAMNVRQASDYDDFFIASKKEVEKQVGVACTDYMKTTI